MSREEFQYQRIFQILKNKIESGSFPKGSSLPSCTKLCKEYTVSAKTMRRVLAMLSGAGLIETSEGKRAVVIDRPAPACPVDQMKEPNPVAMADIIKTAELLCYPFIYRGISLCRGTDWLIPKQIVEQNNPKQSGLFWRNSKSFWRFFIARCENELALRIIGSLGFADLIGLNDSEQIRTDYLEALLHFVEEAEQASCTEEELENFLTEVYHSSPLSKKSFACVVPSDSPFRTGIQSSEQWLKTAEERYSSVYLDILGLISIGHYRPGDQLPSHAALQIQYGVSVVTTLQAVKTLKQWGVVETIRGKGIFVSQNPPAADQLPISQKLIASYVKRYLENFELLALTAEGVALYAAQSVSPAQARALRQRLADLESAGRRSPSFSITVLEFLVEHIPYKAMRAVYATVLENHRMVIKIPGLVGSGNASQVLEMNRRCIGAADALAGGDAVVFAKRTAEMFQYVHRQIIRQCDKFNYLHAAKALYDTSLLWK